MQDFVNILKRIGILSALQLAAVVLPMFLIHENKTAVVLVQLLGILCITWFAYSSGYNAGSRSDPRQSTEEEE